MEREQLIARIKDMIAELHADPRAWFNRDELREVIGSERMIDCVVKIIAAEREESAELKRRGYDYWGKEEPGLRYYRELREAGIRETRAIMSHVETALRNKRTMTQAQWEKPNAGGHTYPGRMRSWERQLKSWPESLQKVYDGLSEREKLYLTKPVPNPTRCDQFPAPAIASVGYFYPQLPVRQREQIAALKAELAQLQKQRPKMQIDELIHNLAVQWFHANGHDEVCLQAMFDIVRGAFQEAQAEAADRS